MKSFEIYDAARKALKHDLYEIYGNRNARMIDYWAQDPAFSADHKRNPIDRLGQLLGRLTRAGCRDVAMSALRILAAELDCVIDNRKDAVPDKETMLGEIVDDMPCLVVYQRALQGNDIEEVDRSEAELQRELAENRVKFLETHQDKTP